MKIKKLTAGAVAVSMAAVLSLFGIPMPFGGKLTLGSMLPVIIISYRMNIGWSLLVSVTYSVIQMLIDFMPPPVQNLPSFFAVILLDYVIAFGCLGFAGAVSSKIKTIRAKYVCGAAFVIVIRFICHFISGILIWSFYAPDGMSAGLYSFLYNGAYMGGELILSCVILFFGAERIHRLKI